MSQDISNPTSPGARPTALRRRLHAVLALAALSAGWPVAGRAQLLVDGVRQAESRQQQLKAQAQRTRDDISGVIAEYQANGLGDSADVQVLTAVQEVLDRVSQQDMDQVIAALGALRQESDPNVTRRQATPVIAAQNEISLTLQQLLLKYQQQHDLALVALRFERLAQRQQANLRVLRRYARLAPGATLFTLQQSQKEHLQIQINEQDTIRREVELELAHLGELGTQAGKEIAQRIALLRADGVEQRLAVALHASVDQLTASHVGLAAANERAAREILRTLARVGTPPADAYQLFRSGSERISLLLRHQSAVIEACADAGPTADPSQDKTAQVEEQQADVVDDTDSAAGDLANAAPLAAEDLASALLKMQHTRRAILAKDASTAARQATLARADLASALQRINATVARLERLARAQTLTEQVAALKECVVALRRDQEELAADTAAKSTRELATPAVRQASLASGACDLVLVATDSAPAVLPDLQAAAAAMESAAAALGERRDAQSSQRSAIEDLTRVEQLLDQRGAQLAQAQQELELLENARQRLAQAILRQERLAVLTGQHAAGASQAPRPAATQATPPPGISSAQALARDEEDVRSRTQAVFQLVISPIPAAGPPLSQAQASAASAARSLQADAAGEAMPAMRAALVQLDAARALVDARISELQALLQHTADQAQQLDALAESIERARQDLQRPVDPARAAAIALRDAQRQIAEELRADPSLPSIAASADRAADRIDQDQLGDALAHMRSAAADMRKASPEQNTPSPHAARLHDLAARQDAAIDTLQQLMRTAQPPPPQPAATLPQENAAPVAAGQMMQVAGDVTRAAINDRGALSADIRQGLSQAEQYLAQAAAEAAAGDQAQARQSREKALRALSAAQSAVASASKQATPPPAPTPSPQARGQMQPSPQAQAAGPKIPGRGKAPNNDRKDDNVDGNAIVNAQRTGDQNLFLRLPPRDRAAIEQSRKDRYPQEYAPLIENYFKNLSEQEN